MRRFFVLFLVVLVPLTCLASPAELIPVLETLITLRAKTISSPETPLTRIEPGAALKKGAKGKRVTQLHTRLNELGFAANVTTDQFDAETDAVVRIYQEKTGIAVDGIVDELTRFNLNLSNHEKVALLSQQFDEMEQFFAQTVDRRFVVVNIPAFSLRAFENGQRVLDSRVIVGKPGRETPKMRSELTGIVLNPTWSPPPTIMAKDVFRSGELNLKAVSHLGLKLVDAQGQEVPLDSISNREYFSDGAYRFYQPSSERNALGVLKFQLDNPLNIYLHDTNHREYFEKELRALSSGCIRVERFRELAAWVLSRSKAEIDQELKDRRTRQLAVEKLPVFTVYWQAEWVGDKIVYHRDIYNQGSRKPSPKKAI